MHFYSPSPLSLGHIPRRSYRPALVSTYPDYESVSAVPFKGLGYLAFPHAVSPRLDAETRYRRAVHELQAAEEEFEAHLSLKRARKAAILREEAMRRERALAIQAEAERIESARALDAKLAEQYEWHHGSHQAEVALDLALRQKRGLLHTFVDGNPRETFAFESPLAKRRRTHSGSSRRADGEVPTLEGLLGLFPRTHLHPHPHSPLGQSGSPAPPQRRSVEPRPTEKQDVAGDAFDAVLKFLHNLAAHSRDAANESETIPEPIPVPQPHATPADGKGKGKASAERAAGPRLLQTLLGAHLQGPSDQELKDIELAIKLSLEDRNTADAKKASPGASSSRVTLDGTVASSHTPSSASNTATAASKPIPSHAPQPVSPLTTIRTVRNKLSNVESTFRFPAAVDFDGSVLAVSPNNASLRAYENTLNGLLEQLDAIESDGDEEVRNLRREVVREVEKALEELERGVSEKAPKPQVTKDVEVKGYDIEAEEPLATQDAVPADATGPDSHAVNSPVDADVDLAISEEYVSSPPTVESPKPVVGPTADEDVSSVNDNETAPDLEDSLDSLATITAAPQSGPPSDVHVPASPAPETFLTSMSHDQFTFPPKPAYSEGAVLVDDSEEGESEKSGDDGWSEVDA